MKGVLVTTFVDVVGEIRTACNVNLETRKVFIEATEPEYEPPSVLVNNCIELENGTTIENDELNDYYTFVVLD